MHIGSGGWDGIVKENAKLARPVSKISKGELNKIIHCCDSFIFDNSWLWGRKYLSRLEIE